MKEKQYQEDLQNLRFAMSHATRDRLRQLQRLLTENSEQETITQELFELNEAMMQLIEYRMADQPYHPMNCQSVVDNVIERLENKYPSSSITYHNLPELLMGVEKYIEILFYELLDNALKFSNKSPSIEIRCHKEENHYEFSIHDNGIGIEEELYEIIFVLFQRGLDVESYDGLGKGLALTKNIVELHNGTIWVDQSNATGSSIKFTLNKRQEIL